MPSRKVALGELGVLQHALAALAAPHLSRVWRGTAVRLGRDATLPRATRLLRRASWADSSACSHFH